MVVGNAVAEQRDEQRVDRLFHALADATRRDIVRHAMHAEQSVSTLARRYPMSFAAVQKHVAVLADAGLVTKRRSGREQLVQGNVATIEELHRLLDEFQAMWRDRLDRFGAALDEDAASNERKKR